MITYLLKIKTLYLIYFFVLFSIISCGDNDVDSSNNVQSEIENDMQSGTWQITKFIDSGKDELNHFNGYNFTFKSSDVLNANNGTNDYNGTWSISDSNNNDDSKDDLHFNIHFTSPDDFEDLSDDWDVISLTSTKIELIDISGGNGGTDYLTFNKN